MIGVMKFIGIVLAATKANGLYAPTAQARS